MMPQFPLPKLIIAIWGWLIVTGAGRLVASIVTATMRKNFFFIFV
jgi:hypothetical protein